MSSCPSVTSAVPWHGLWVPWMEEGGACAYGASPGCPICRQSLRRRQRALTGETGAYGQTGGTHGCIGSGVPAHGRLSKAEDSRVVSTLDASAAWCLHRAAQWVRIVSFSASSARNALDPDRHPQPSQPRRSLPLVVAEPEARGRKGESGPGVILPFHAPPRPYSSMLVRRAGGGGHMDSSECHPASASNMAARARMYAYALVCLSAPPTVLNENNSTRPHQPPE